jgi:hypothetical protein
MASRKATTQTTDPVNTTVTRVIDLDPAEWFLATWRKLEPLPRPQPAPFDHLACVARLERVTTASYPHPWNWHRANIADALTPQEAHFWFAAMTGIGRDVKPRELALHLSRQVFTGNLSRADIEAKLRLKGDTLPAELVAVLANLLSLEELVPLLLKLAAIWGRDFAGWTEQRRRIADGFARHVVPYLGAAQRRAIQDLLREDLDPGRFMPHAAEFSLSCMAYRLAACLGMHAEVAALVDSWSRPYPSHQALVEEVIFGLGDPHRVATVMRGLLGRSLSTSRSLCSWLAHTELTGLDLVRDSILHCPVRERAEEFLAIFCRVRAPEAAPLMLELRLNYRAPRLAREWLQREVGNGVAGLLPVAAGRGRLAEAALDYLREVKARGFAGVIEEQLARVPPAVAGRVRRAVFATGERSCAVFAEAELPDWLRRGLEQARPRGGRLPGWLSVFNLPPLALNGRCLSADEVPAVLNALRSSTLDTPHPLVAALRQTADATTLDAFAWRLCELWLAEAAPARDRWALQATGLFGGGCALKLAAQVRTWAAERQRLRAVVGLECLKAIGSDLALMQLGALSRKVRYRTVREKAEELLAEVAGERGLSHEQLEDRFVPDLELDRTGSRTFDFGPRQFRMVLAPDFKPLLRDGAGKLRADLPRPGVKDDRSKADAAVQTWRLLKKQLREALKVQTERLERAMIESRRWTAGDFEKFLVNHPLLGNLARLLLWGTFEQEGKLTASFRLTEEKEYADAKDRCFKLDRSAAVGLVHPLYLSEQERAAWGDILGDYGIIQPFAQLSRRVHTLQPGEEGQQLLRRFRETEIEYRVAYGTLRAAGWVSTWGNARFVKYFPGAGLTAFLQADGPDLLTLGSLFFLGGTVHTRPDPADALLLGEVDPVVLSEVLGAVSAVAAKGRVTAI